MDSPMRTPSYIQTQTMTITPQESQKPQHLVLRLKGMKTEAQQKKLEAQQKVDESVQHLAQSTLGQSMLNQSTVGQSNMLSSMQASFSYIDPEISDENEANEVREEVFKQEDALEELQDADFEEHVIDEGLAMANNVQHEQEQISYLQTAVSMCTNIAKKQGTTLVTALVTGGATVAATVSAPALLGLVTAIGGGLIVGNEIKKMVLEELNDIGANEHLKVLEGALNNLEDRNKMAKELIEKASGKQQKIHSKLAEVELEIKGLQIDLETAQGDLKEAIILALDNHDKLRRNLMQQSYDAESAIQGTMNSMEILLQQQGKIKQLMKAEYSIKTEQDLEEVMNTINKELGDILKMSETTYKQLVTTLNYMMSVSKTQKVIVGRVHQSYELIGKMKSIDFQLQQAKEKADSAEKKNAEMQKVNKAQAEDLQNLEKARKEDERDIKVGKDMLEKEKQLEKFGNESIIMGNFIATGGSATLGFIFGGGIGGVGLGALGTCLSPSAIRGVHYARKFLRGKERLNDKGMAEKLQSDLKTASQQKQGHKIPITIKASYASSQGNIFQKAGKGLWNLGAFTTSYAYGTENTNYWLSAYAGSVQCTLANASFDLSFHKNNDKSYGAVNIEEQQNLSKILGAALDDGMHPQAVLDLLDGLSQVNINHEVIVMISLSSPAMANLRDKCNALLQKAGRND